jgi:hypothetical protein
LRCAPAGSVSSSCICKSTSTSRCKVGSWKPYELIEVKRGMAASTASHQFCHQAVVSSVNTRLAIDQLQGRRLKR